MKNRLNAVTLLTSAILFAGVCANAASPLIGNLLPRGAQRGTSIEIHFYGLRLADAIDVVFHDPGISMVRAVIAGEGEFACEIAIAPDCALGRHIMRVRTASGLSNPFIFSVGALPEAAETEPNGDPSQSQAVALGTTINGVVTNEDVDFYSIELAQGGRLAVEVEAIRLGHTLFDPKLRLFGPRGHELVSEDDTPAMRQDAAFVYTAAEAGIYRVAISEASYGGNDGCEYRLHVGTFPRPLAVSPLGGKVGEPLAVRWLGDPAGGQSEVVPASFSRGNAQIELSSDAGFAPTPMPFRASGLPIVLEAEPNDAPEQAAAIPVPGAYEGIIDRPGDIDWIAFDGLKDQVYDVRVVARELGTPLDSVIEVKNPDGSQLLYNDDSNGPDSSGRITLPVDGRYTAYVRDHLNHGGETFAYRFELAPVRPALWFAPVDNEAGMLSVARGNSAFLLLSVNRREFDGDLEFAFEGLPAGVTADYPPVPTGAAHIPVVFTAAVDAAPAAALVELKGAWKNGDDITTGGMSHTVRLVLGVNQTVFDSLHVDRLAFAVSEEAPFSLELVPPKSAIPVMGRCTVTVRAHRKEGFTAAIGVRPPWAPGSIGLPAVTIPEGASEVPLRLEVNPGAAIGTSYVTLIGESEGYTVATPFTPIQVEDPWIALDIQEAQGEQGKTIAWAAKLNVNKPLEGEVALDTGGLPKGVTAEAVRVAAVSADISIPMAIAADAPAGKQGPIGFRTDVTMNGETITIALGGADLKIFEPLPQELAAPVPEPAPETAAAQPEEAPARRTRFPTEM